MPDTFLRPVSPPLYSRAANSPYFQIALYAAGNVLAVGICILLWFCWDVLSAFEEPLLWAWLCSLSLRDIKQYLVTTARRELQTSSFPVCVFKLVFLPAVILWQLFEEVRDQLQAKYQELQHKTPHQGAVSSGSAQSPVQNDGAEAGAENPAAVQKQSKHSRQPAKQDAPSGNILAQQVQEPPADVQQQQQQEHAATKPAAAEHSDESRSDGNSSVLKQPTHKQQQQLRQRKAAGCKQTQQQQRQQRPPLGPSRAGTAAAYSRKDTQAVSGVKARSHLKFPPSVRRPASSTAAATAKHNRFRRRMLQLRHTAFKQLRWWWFCIAELFKFFLKGLLPQRQQQQQQQLLVQQSYAIPAAVRPASVRSSSPGFSHGGVESSSASTPVRVSLTGSYSSSCISDWGQPWTPPQPLWQQQQQQSFTPSHQLQHKRLSSSYSSPTLHMESTASLQFPSSTMHSPAAAAAAVAAAARHHSSAGTAADDMVLGTSFGGWASGKLRYEVLQQQQQQLSRCSSNNSSTSQHQPVAVADLVTQSEASKQPADSSSISSSNMMNGHNISLAPSGFVESYNMTSVTTAAGFNSPDQLGFSPAPSQGLVTPGPGAGYGGSVSLNPSLPNGLQHMQSMPAAGTFGVGGWSCSGAAAAAAGAPGSATLPLPGSSSSSSPSSLLFKWLLRGIVLYEGYSWLQSFLSGAEPLFVLLLSLGFVLAVAGGLPLLLLPGNIWRSPALMHEKEEASLSPEQQQQDMMRSPFQQQQEISAAAAAAGGVGVTKENSSNSSSSSSSSNSCWSWISSVSSTAWSQIGQLLTKVDIILRSFCSSSFLDTAVSGLIVVGLILGSVVLSVILVVQVGEESRQAVLHLNTMVRNKGTEAALRQGVQSLLQDQYLVLLEGQVTGMLKDSLPSVTRYVESWASEFLLSHNLSRVLLDLEKVKAALRLPGDCGDEAKMKLAVQLANSSLAVRDLGQQREQLQQQLQKDMQLMSQLVGQYEAVQVPEQSGSTGGVLPSWLDAVGESLQEKSSTGFSRSGVSCDHNADSLAADAAAHNAPGEEDDAADDSSSSSSIAHQLLEVQGRLEGVQDKLSGYDAAFEAATEQLQLAQIRLRNCQPAFTEAAGASDVATNGRSILSGIWSSSGHSSTADGSTGAAAAAAAGSGQYNNFGAVYARMWSALLHWDFAAAGKEAAALLGQLYLVDQQQQQQQQHEVHEQDHQQMLSTADDGMCQLAGVSSCPAANYSSSSSIDASRQLHCAPSAAAGLDISSSDNTATAAAAARSPGSSSSSVSAPTGVATNIMRVAQAAAHPLVSTLRQLGSVFLSGVGSTTAVALGTGLGVLRLGLGVVKFLVQLGVFASVLYTLLALDIDPVEQLLRLLPLSEASQARASRAVTKAMRGVFVSSLKLAAFHAGFTWLTLRAFGTHFVTLASAASAVVAVLPLVPVALVALPGVLELALLRGAPVKGVVLAALHFGAYYFGDDLIYREVEPTLPYLVGLGVFGGMYSFRNPLRGVVLGPMMLALLSVGYNLHRDMY